MQQGATLAGRFVIEGLSRSGAMAAVFKARDLLTNEHVALKVLYGDFDEQVARFQREAKILSELDHPHIVKYVAHGQTPDGGRYLAMEWLRGEDLQRHLSRADMTVGETMRLIARIADGLAICHEAGIVHRDIKPANLFLRDCKPAKVTLIDFGIALASDGTLRTDPGITLGSPGYMAPEQAQSGMKVDHRADIFSLGCVLFRCLTGRRAFVGDSPMAVMAKTILEEAPRVSQFRANIPDPVDDFTARLLAQDPEQRPSSVREVAEHLHALSRERSTGKMKKLRFMKALTTGEKRLLSVVMARMPRSSQDTSKGRVRQLTTTIDTTEVAEIVRSFGGKLTELANGTMVVTLEGFGAATDQSARAAHCALALREALPGTRIAMATGSGELTQRPVGEVIERAAALLRAERDSDAVRVDSITAGLLDSRFDVAADAIGFTLRGQKASLEGTRTLMGRPTPCVGRVRELGFLDAIFEETAEERTANAVVVTGPAGIGKSRLRYEFLLNLQGRRDNVEIWFGRGDPVSAGAPFSLVAPAIRHAAGFIEGEPVEERRAKLSERLCRFLDAQQIQRVATFVGELIGLRAQEADTQLLKAARLDPVLMHDQMRRAWEDLLAAELEHHPVVLLLEDLQWGDLPSVNFIDEALRSLHDRPLFVLALARPEVDDEFPNLWKERNCTRIQLEELSKKASLTLVREVLGNRVDDTTADSLVEQAAGNAFYLEELIRAVAEGTNSRKRLPPTILAMAQARIEGLHADSRRILRAASIFGRAFTPSAVELLLGGPDQAPNVGMRLAQLAKDEVISRLPEPPRDSDRVFEAQYSFRHELVRQAAYSMLTEDDQVLGHRMAALWLEENDVGDAYSLADHFERGELPERAVRYFKTAAEQALEGNDIEAAIERAERGVRCGAAGEDLGLLRLMQAEACQWQGMHQDSERYANEALQQVRRATGPWFQAAGLVAVAAGSVGHWDALVNMGADLAEMIPADAVIGEHLIAMAHTADRLFAVGRYEQAETLIGRIEDATWHPQAQTSEVLGWLYRLRAYKSLLFGAPVTFLDEIEQSAIHFEEGEQLRNALLQRCALGYGYIHIGSYHQACAILEGVREQASHLDLSNVVTLVEANLGIALAHREHLDEARSLLSHAANSAADQCNAQLEGFSRLNLANLLVEQLDLDAAEAEARRAIDVLEIYLPDRATALATCARILIRRGHLEEAQAMAEDAVDLLESLGGIADGESLVRLTHSEALQAMGEMEAAAEAIGLAHERLIERADMIADDNIRNHFLRSVPSNARTLALHQQWETRAS